MSKKTKRLAKGLGASALAIATIASGLSFGAASASAAPAASTDTTAKVFGNMKWVNLTTKQSFENPIPFYVPTAVWGLNTIKPASSMAEADNKAALLPRIGTTWSTWQSGDLCLAFNGLYSTDIGGVVATRWAPCGGSGVAKMRVSDAGELEMYSVGSGTVKFWGAITSGANDWSLAFTKAGGGELGGDYAQKRLTATGSFATDIADRATISGTAEKGATVVIKMGTIEVGRVTADANDGSYTWSVPAPMQAGVKNFAVSQISGGTESGNVAVSLDYGNAVAITDPANNSAQPIGTKTIRGTTQAGASVSVKVNGGTAINATVTGTTWTAEATLRRGENTIEATQKSKGANTTTSSVVVNPGEDTTIPFSVTSPTNNSTVSGPTVDFTGRAEPGTQVRIVEGGGTVMTRVDADASGNWGGTSANLTNGVHNLTVQFTEPGQAQKTQPLTITVQNGVVQPFSITAPTDGARLPAGPFDITGLATSGTKVNVVNNRGQIVMTTTDTDLAGDWTGRATLLAGTHTLTAQYMEPGAQKRMVDFTVTVEGGVTQPFRVTGPADGATVTSNTFDVTGIGSTGTVVNAIRVGDSNLVMPTTKIDDAGNWAGKITLPNGTHDITVQYLEPNTGNKRMVDFTVTVEGGTQQPFAVSTPADGDVINSNNFEFTGVGSTGTTVNVVNKRGGAVMASTTIGADGSWSGAATLPNGGPHEVTVQYLVPGTPGKQTVQMSLTVVGGVNQPFEVTSPADGDVVSTNPQGTVTFTGKASTGTMVNVIRNGSTTPVMPTLTVDASGNWTGTADLPDGVNGLMVQYIEPGTPGKQSMPLTITVERATVQPFAFTSHQDGDVVTAGAPVTFAGTGTTGTKVNVINIHGNEFLKEVIVDAKGNWSGQSVNIPRGKHSLVLQYTEPAVPGKQTVNFELTGQ